jgi:hypothetical protein
VSCVACSIFRKELQSLSESGAISFPTRYLDSMLHIRPELLRRKLSTVLDPQQRSPEAATVLLIYGFCHSHMDVHESIPGVRRVAGSNCVELLLGHETYVAMRREGVFFLLPEWAHRWREVFSKELGLSDENAQSMMQDMHTRLVYLDTALIPVPTAALEDASNVLGLPWEVLPVSLDIFRNGILKALEEGDARG